MTEITVIVPIYKVEKYLARCVDSIKDQTFKVFELWQVDDGSPDRCPEVCDEYAILDSRQLVIHKINGGLSDARNYALELAGGKYLTFVDSDDWLEKDALETMRGALIRTGADIAVGNMLSVTEDGTVGEMFDNVPEETVLKNAEIWETLNRPCAPKKLYKSYIWEKLRFPVGRLYEDAFTCHHVLEQVKSIVKTGKTVYYYFIRQGSIMHTEYNIRFTDIIDAVEDRIDTLENLDLNALADKNRMFIYSQTAVAMAHLDRKDEKQKTRADEVWRIYKKHFPKLMRCRCANLKEKILFLLLRVAPGLHAKYFGSKMPLNLGG